MHFCSQTTRMINGKRESLGQCGIDSAEMNIRCAATAINDIMLDKISAIDMKLMLMHGLEVCSNTAANNFFSTMTPRESD